MRRKPRVVAVEQARVTKLAPRGQECSATYVTQASCPSTCVHLGDGCYAEYGHVAFTTSRLNATRQENDAREIAREEARAIGGLSGIRPLRLHVVGDARTQSAAQELARAAEMYSARGGVDAPVWTYSHAWRAQTRDAWGPISVLASLERVADIDEARERGFASAIVVNYHASPKAYKVRGETLIPCPQQTVGRTCVECRLCWNDAALYARGASIAFAAHGSGASKVRRKL